MRRDDRALLVDALAVLVVGAAACVARAHVAAMWGVVALAWLGRLTLRGETRPTLSALSREFALTAGCALVGYANDWNTVVRHGVYDYGGPHDLAPWSSIPSWMLGFWGLIFRFVLTLSAWERLGERSPAGEIRLGPWARGRTHPWLRRALVLALVLVTRQAIYRLWAHPVLSWAPFAAALGAHAWLFPWGRRERSLVLLALTVGPLAEAALIASGLHQYALGWLVGVPVWIALWWALGALTLAELASALPHETLAERTQDAPQTRTPPTGADERLRPTAFSSTISGVTDGD